MNISYCFRGRSDLSFKKTVVSNFNTQSYCHVEGVDTVSTTFDLPKTQVLWLYTSWERINRHTVTHQTGFWEWVTFSHVKSILQTIWNITHCVFCFTSIFSVCDSIAEHYYLFVGHIQIHNTVKIQPSLAW